MWRNIFNREKREQNMSLFCPFIKELCKEEECELYMLEIEDTDIKGYCSIWSVGAELENISSALCDLVDKLDVSIKENGPQSK